uniref:DUF148 domain-containing protein n=1 Tax=Globodera rostochiensis TaxID=31243 RepID=A0A914HTW9_GLORO
MKKLQPFDGGGIDLLLSRVSYQLTDLLRSVSLLTSCTSAFLLLVLVAFAFLCLAVGILLWNAYGALFKDEVVGRIGCKFDEFNKRQLDRCSDGHGQEVGSSPAPVDLVELSVVLVGSSISAPVDQLLQTATDLLGGLLSQLQTLLSAVQLILPIIVGIFALFCAFFLLLARANRQNCPAEVRKNWWRKYHRRTEANNANVSQVPCRWIKSLRTSTIALVELVDHVNRFLSVLTIFLPVFIVSLALFLIMIIALLALSIFLQFKRHINQSRGEKMEGNGASRMRRPEEGEAAYGIQWSRPHQEEAIPSPPSEMTSPTSPTGEGIPLPSVTLLEGKEGRRRFWPIQTANAFPSSNNERAAYPADHVGTTPVSPGLSPTSDSVFLPANVVFGRHGAHNAGQFSAWGVS